MMNLEIVPREDNQIVGAMIVIVNNETKNDFLAVYRDDDLAVHFWSKGKIVYELSRQDLPRTLNQKIDYISFVKRNEDNLIVISVYTIKSKKGVGFYFDWLPYRDYPSYIKSHLSLYELYFKVCGYNIDYFPK